jgi:trans-AT polyketide synthase, acyltransferase and oxidoreductase domains
MALSPPRDPIVLCRDPTTLELFVRGAGAEDPAGIFPPLYPEWLGDRAFLDAHGVRFPYLTGSMANGIATPRLVVAMGRAGMLGFFGAAGLSVDRVEAGLDEIARRLEGQPHAWGANLIHSPAEPALEARVAKLYADRRVPCVEASAFMDLTPSVVRLACRGLYVDAEGRIARRHRLIAKVSRPEVARRFMSPPPPEMLRTLVERGDLSEEEARLAARVPIANDITVEADSGGHTDNRPLVALLPRMLALRDEIESELALEDADPVRVGAAGGIGTPAAAAAAFALGAAYVMTGSVNQAAVESGLSDDGRRMLAQADIADVAMAAAADMFELGVKLQVLQRGTLFAPRANRLYEVYRENASLDALDAPTRAELEKIFGQPIEAVLHETESFWGTREPGELDRAHADPKHGLALVLRWYLGKSSRWAIAGETARRGDYQIWCGPAMGSFNAWVKGSFLEDVAERSVVQIARNLLEGAAAVTRTQQLRSYGVAVSSDAFHFRPRFLE